MSSKTSRVGLCECLSLYGERVVLRDNVAVYVHCDLNIMWLQKEVSLKPRSRGFHLVTDELLRELPELRNFKVGMMNVFILHTSASLTLNENADPTVRQDFESYFNRAVPEDEPYYRHQDEGPDDLPAHIKSSLLGSSLNIPVSHGRLRLGTWQGIYLCEHRDHGGSRRIVVTVQGEPD